ncbi:rhodanese-like domain-containing protein [Candidatus Enterococcus willemsii]|uniref:Rhodanese n=1 Tax=Candidatus Enterococcus willemsii TaxID=1857215 RepID=A0ABQ6YWC1_9ENTE|nr:rhodanese-like domain-containing protein [Enterococcus sp. CU12B]KAF1302003.1 rhodanese [Enterococcus sp. CU12B]
MFSSISMEEFAKRREEPLTIIDVRDALPFEQNHLPEAINIPIGELANAIPALSPETTYYVVCTMGVRSVQACEFLANEGFDVINVEGGMNAFRTLA